jgi:alpha-glucosidase
MTDWSARDITINLPVPANSCTLWRDGVNAARNACDYRKETVAIRDGRISVHLAPGGACVLEI